MPKYMMVGLQKPLENKGFPDIMWNGGEASQKITGLQFISTG
ncbi:hypothetical protein ABH973_003763 [Bradyrhizobium ottawaense]